MYLFMQLIAVAVNDTQLLQSALSTMTFEQAVKPILGYCQLMKNTMQHASTHQTL